MATIDDIRTVFTSPAAIWAIVLIFLTTLYFKSDSAGTKKETVGDDWSSLYGEAQNTDVGKVQSTPIPQSGSSSELKNVFDVKQSPPKVQEAAFSDKTDSDDKPFKSSYYYAHNNPNTTGGYKDGLKAEDYVMNGPRLLSKSEKSDDALNVSTATTSKTDVAATKIKIDSTAINRYLWDDDGNSDGIARIIINTLPSSNAGSPSTSVNWQDMGITKDDVKSKLVGVSKNGLQIQIRHKISDEDISSYKRYHLHVPRMFGKVDEVKLLVKAKKLIVKLYKKKEIDNLKAWPQLPSQVAKPIPSSHDVGYLEEDFFHIDNSEETE